MRRSILAAVAATLLLAAPVAAKEAHYGDLQFATHCDGVVVIGQLDDESDRAFGYEVRRGDAIVAAGLVDVPESGAFKVDLALPAGDYTMRWDDEAVDASYQPEQFTIPECPEPTPPPSEEPTCGLPEGCGPRPTPPPTDAIGSPDAPVNGGWWLGLLVIGEAAAAVVVRRKIR